jgi:hypothetical protein
MIEGILDIDDKAAGAAQCLADGIHSRNDIAGGGNLGDGAGRHEAILQIDHDMGGSFGVEAIEDAESAAPLGDASENLGMNGAFVHASPHLPIC